MAHNRRTIVIAALLALSLLVAAPGLAGGDKASGLSAIQHEMLSNSKYVYISSSRADGSFGKPAEIWFLFHEDAVWVGTRPDSWRAKRIRAGRPQAKIAIGKVDGVSFLAEGEIVDDAKIAGLMMQSYAIKYPDGWSRFAESFRTGFADGSRILIRYTPKR